MVFLYVRNSWVVMDKILKVLEGFHHRGSQMISGMSDQRFREVLL